MGRMMHGAEKGLWPPIPPGPTLLRPWFYQGAPLGRCPRLTFVLPSSSLSLKMAKRRARVAVAAAVVVAAAAAVLVAAAGHRPPQKTQLLRQARPREKHRLETMAMRRGC